MGQAEEVLSREDEAWIRGVAEQVRRLPHLRKNEQGWAPVIREREREARKLIGDQAFEALLRSQDGPEEDADFQFLPSWLHPSPATTFVVVLFVALGVIATLPLWEHLGLH